MENLLEPSWRKALATELKAPYFEKLGQVISHAYKETTVYPAFADIFNAFKRCPFSNVQVVLLGQDPYHGTNQAHGLAFSVPGTITIPPSLKNIYKERLSDLGIPIPASGNLEAWADQGVLLLNTTLTVLPGLPGSHQKLGWEEFTDAVIKKISAEKEHVVFILWGNHAATKAPYINRNKHYVLMAPHPSPLSAYKGFFGSKPFSKTNTYLTTYGKKPIDW